MTVEFEIAVIGSGIAGLTAGLTAARLGRSTLLLTGDTLGGHLLSIERVDGYPGFADGVAGYDLCPTVQEQATTAGAQVTMAAVSSIAEDGDGWCLVTPAEVYSARAVIVATGTRFRSLDVPGEELLKGKGVSQCASCDAPLLGGKEVVVAGGGDSALQEALTLAEHCSKVTIVHLGPELTGQASYRELATANDRIECIPEAKITEIVGDDAVTGVKVENGRGVREIECESVFVFVGLQPNSEILEPLGVLTDDACVATDAEMHTTKRGLLAAGTVRDKSAGRAAAASGDGALAALTANRYLNDGKWDCMP